MESTLYFLNLSFTAWNISLDNFKNQLFIKFKKKMNYRIREIPNYVFQDPSQIYCSGRWLYSPVQATMCSAVFKSLNYYKWGSEKCVYRKCTGLLKVFVLGETEEEIFLQHKCRQQLIRMYMILQHHLYFVNLKINESCLAYK